MQSKSASLISLSNAVSDELWFVVQFWSPFSQSIIGKHFINSLDQIAVLASQIKLTKKEQKIAYLQKIQLLITESFIWLDKSRRRRLLDNENYQKFYNELKLLKDKAKY